MADGFRIEMDTDKSAQLQAAAREQGLEPAEYARRLLERALDDEADRAEIGRRLMRHDATGEAIDHAEIVALLQRRSAD